MRNYFRLARVQEELRRRSRPASRVSTLNVLEAERARLAHELHAGAGQALAGIKIHLQLIDSFLENPPEQVRGSLHRIGLLAQEALDQVRAISRRVHPPDWERVPLGVAIKTLWDVTGIPQKFQASLEIDNVSEPPRHLHILIYRVLQEALANIIRHARASRVGLRLWEQDGRICLRVEDDGQGFDAANALSPNGRAGAGIGLRSMREQVTQPGGEFKIESGPHGTTLFITLPLVEK